MIQLKVLGSIFCILAIMLCSLPAKNSDTKNSDANTQPGNNANTFADNNNSEANNNVYKNSDSKGIYGVWGGGNLTSSEIEKYPFLKGWYIVYQWGKLEPQKDNFDWEYFDSKMKFAADNNLPIGFMVWVGPHSPEWLYTNGVPKVSTNTKKKLADFPYYLNPVYKDRYFNMMKVVANHLETLPSNTRNKIVLWMSAEGSTGDETPYKGYPNDPKYNITDQQWFDFKKEVWTYLYKFCQSSNPHINLLVNQGNGGKYFDWLTTNLPKVWMKAGNISQTYQFNGELEYYNRLKKLESKIESDSSLSRLRGEISVQGKWFNQNESWNMYALLTSCLHFGLDLFVIAPKYLQNPIDSISFNFFNFYAGQKNPYKSTGAFCILKDGLDAADTKRFPESTYGPVIDPANMDKYNKEMQRKGHKEEDDEDDVTDQGIKQSNIKNDNLSQTRINKILQEYAPYGAKRGDLNNLIDSSSSEFSDSNDDNSTSGNSRNPNRVARNPNRAGKNIDRQGKRAGGGIKNIDDGEKGSAYERKREANMVINDIGVNLVPDNYYKFLTQYSPNTTSHGYWRIGPHDEPYGRFARGFDAKNGMDEMLFVLDKRFFSGSTNAQKIAIRIIYLDKGNGAWSLNYYNGSSKKEAYKIACGNTGRWITKTVELADAFFTQRLEHNCDLSIKYLSGDNTVFNSIEVLRQ